mmetsp:Transcript_48612/g.145164  ORF Transcript_48612/g.145164 Transcript_48612/m.145164 type:complete len:390 (+) Transcript_48612:245-1414(+)
MPGICMPPQGDCHWELLPSPGGGRPPKGGMPPPGNDGRGPHGAPESGPDPQLPCWPPPPRSEYWLLPRSRTSAMRKRAREHASREPLMRTRQGSPSLVFTSSLAPLSRCSRWMVSPPLPMTRPTIERGTSIWSLASARRVPWPSSARAATIFRARSTCSGVPEICTLQQSSSFSTETFAPVAALTSEIWAPREPMILPVAATGNSMVLVTLLPPVLLPEPQVSLRGWPPPRGPSRASSSSARFLTSSFALSTCSGVPEMVTLQRPSPFSTWTLAPLCCLTSEILAPRMPMMPPIRATGNSIVSLVPVPEDTAPSVAPGPPGPSRVFSETSVISALARSTASGVPWILNSHMSSFLSSASIRAPLASRMPLMVEPCLPMTRPMMWRGSLR